MKSAQISTHISAVDVFLKLTEIFGLVSERKVMLQIRH